MKDLGKELEAIFEDMDKKAQEEWESKTTQEKMNAYREQTLYSRYCDMSIEELEEEKKFNIEMANKLRGSIFKSPYYSAYGCEENIRRINTILKLKKEMNE